MLLEPLGMVCRAQRSSHTIYVWTLNFDRYLGSKAPKASKCTAPPPALRKGVLGSFLK
jgi:hypothetical protein